jgi:hypothetical protein
MDNSQNQKHNSQPEGDNSQTFKLNSQWKKSLQKEGIIVTTLAAINKIHVPIPCRNRLHRTEYCNNSLENLRKLHRT